MAGTIIKKGDNAWMVRIYLGRDAKGKTKHFNKLIHGLKKDAQQYLNAKMRDRDLGTFITPTSDTVDIYLDRWLKEVAKNKLSVRTFANTESLLENHIRPRIGLKRLTELQAYEIQNIYNEMTTAGYSPRTVRHTHTALSSALKQAVKWRLIFQNPCGLCELPRMTKREMKYFTVEEVKVFLEYAKTDRYYAAFLLAIETGMRPEEYLGLQWKDVDLDEGALTVRRALITHKGGGYEFAEPKTPKSRRSIPLTPESVTVLKAHKRKQLEERLSLGTAYTNLDLVFASSVGTPVQHRNFDRRHFHAIIKCANERIEEENLKNNTNDPKLPILRLYDLRHTMATLLLSAGVNPKVVSERLGHASVVLTLDTYSHVLPTMQKAATSEIGKLMFGA